MIKKTIQLNGMNKGGNAHLDETLDLAPEGVREADVHIVDPEPGRSAERATELKSDPSMGVSWDEVQDMR